MIISSTSLAQFAALLGDPTRASMCLALMDGRAWTLGELARQSAVARSTASEHATALVAAGMLAEERQGRHRYLRLADAGVAGLVEDLAAAVGQPAPAPTSLRASRERSKLAAARTCYDHLAGVLGVTLLDAFVERHLIGRADGFALTRAGRAWFIEFAGEQSVLVTGARPLLRPCLDWTERRHHLGGALGAVLYSQLCDRGWVMPADQQRAVVLSRSGAEDLGRLLGRDLRSLVTSDPG